MTNIESLELLHLWANCWKSHIASPSTDILYAYTKLRDLINEHEKCRWHDLRKNKNDLPKPFKPVVCILNGLYEVGEYQSVNDRWALSSGVFRTKHISKWKYIESDN